MVVQVSGDNGRGDLALAEHGESLPQQIKQIWQVVIRAASWRPTSGVHIGEQAVGSHTL
jgi:hypothetical protein